LHWIWQRILHVDLTQKKIRILKPPLEVYRLLLGGRGLAAYLLKKMASSNTDPLGESNPLIIAPGLLTGSGLSTASKTIIAGRSPLTGLLGRSSVGARLGASLRYAGYDALVVTGRLEEPGALIIDGKTVRVVDASNLWGKTTGETRRILAREYPGFNHCTIGPAGENLSRISLIDCE
jgi:aldehyde:ferredoxin oxidoreductase